MRPTATGGISSLVPLASPDTNKRGRRRPLHLVPQRPDRHSKRTTPWCRTGCRRVSPWLTTTSIATLFFLLGALLYRHGCDAYLSTMHLGRTLKAFRTADADDAVLDDPRHSLNLAPSNQPPQQQRLELDSDDARAMDQTSGAGEALGETHPSWAGATGSATPAVTTAVADTYTASSRSSEDGSESIELGERESSKCNEHTNVDNTAATAAAEDTASTMRVPRGEDSAVVDGEDGEATTTGLPSVEEEPVDTANIDVGIVRDALGARGDTGLTRISLPQKRHQQAEVNDLVHEARPATTETAIFNSENPDADSALEFLQSPKVEGSSAEPGAASAAAAMAEDGDEEEDIENAAMRKLLRLREEQDSRVRAAAEAALEELPGHQRARFDELKAFAYGSTSSDAQQNGAIEEGLSADEAGALDLVAICGDRNGVVLAFLRHSKFDVKKAKESMRRCVKWRMETKADDMFARSVPSAKMRKYRTYWPSGFHKEDRAGRPVFYDRVGQVDLTALRTEPDALDMDDMVKIFCQNMESRRRFVLTRLSRQAGRPVDQMTTVLDLSGMGMKHLTSEALTYTRRIGDIFHDNYSGMTTSLLVVNTPWIFSKGWQMIEGFLSEDTVAKIKVLGKGEASLDKLAEYIPMENIPDFLGGPSKTTVGAADPLWAEIDAATSAWANGSDPFIDKRMLRKIRGRLRRERAARDDSAAMAATPAVAVPPTTSVTAEQPSVSSVVGPGAIGTPTADGEVSPGVGVRRYVARKAKTSSSPGEREGRGVVPAGLGDKQGTTEDDAKKALVSAGRRARRKSDPATSARTRVDGKKRVLQERSRHRGEAKSGRGPVTAGGNISLRQREKKHPTSRRKPARVGSSRRPDKRNHPVAVRTTGVDEHRSRSREERDEADDRGVTVKDAGEMGLVQWLVQQFVPAAKAVILLVVSSILDISKFVFNAALTSLRFLRDALFEQVEEDDE